MANLLGFMAAGAAQGVGEGIAARAEAERESALDQVRAMREQGMLERRFEFEREQNAANREYQAQRDEANRAHDLVLQDRADARAAAGRAPRDKYAETYVGTDGNMYGRTHDGTVEMLKDTEGKPAAGRRGGGDSDSVTARQREEWIRDRAAELTEPNDFGEPGLPFAEAMAQARQEMEMSLGRTAAAAPAPAAGGEPAAKGDTPPPDKKKPDAYPDAVWSEKAGAWVVQRGGKWHAIR